MKIINFNNNTSRILKLTSYVSTREIIALRNELVNMDGFKEILVDLSDVIYIDDEFIDTLKSIRVQQFKSYSKIILLNPSEIVRKMLEMGQIPELYKIQYIQSTVW
jgi:anti-anti-sigma regulatory factor